MFKTYEKMNAAIMKNEFKRNAGKAYGKGYNNNYFQAGNDGFVYCCIDGNRMYRIIKDDFLLDIEKLPENKSLTEIYDKLQYKGNFRLFYTGTTILHDGVKLAEFGSDDHVYIYYNEKYLKEFGDLNDLMLETADELHPAIISSVECNNIQIGIICPVKR